MTREKKIESFEQCGLTLGPGTNNIGASNLGDSVPHNRTMRHRALNNQPISDGLNNLMIFGTQDSLPQSVRDLNTITEAKWNIKTAIGTSRLETDIKESQFQSQKCPIPTPFKDRHSK